MVSDKLSVNKFALLTKIEITGMSLDNTPVKSIIWNELI
jgi:hypothetical protein